MTTSSKSSQKTDPQPLAGWIEVFRAGKHVDSKGRECAFSQSDLDQMVANHALGAAPIVLGHPRDSDPAYGWADGYKREGDSLFARFVDVRPEFSRGVAGGAYRNRSLSVFKDGERGWRVRHVGFLGAVPPAIEGLKPLQFAAPEDACFEFSAAGASLVWGLESSAKCLRGLRDWLIERDGVDAADKVLPQWQIDSINESAQQAQTEYRAAAETKIDPPENHFSNDPKGTVTMSQQQQDALAAAQAAQQAAEDKAAEFARESKAKDDELAILRKERQAERLGAQVEGLVKSGRVTPAQRAGMVEFMSSIEDADKEFSFSAADKSDAKKTPAQWFADFAASLPVQAALGKTVGDAAADAVDAPKDASSIAAAAQDYMAAQQAKGRTVELHDAIAHVSAGAA